MTQGIASHQRRGRPPGPTPVAAMATIRLDDLAVVRAVVQGVPLRKAAMQFWPDGESDLRVLATRFNTTMQGLSGVLSANDSQALKAWARGRETRNDDESIGQPEDFEAFAQRYEGFSEQELIEAYADHCSRVAPVADAPNSEQLLRAINSAQSTYGAAPKHDDALVKWLCESLVSALGSVGCITLGDLVCFRQTHPSRYWWRHVKGLGRVRAERLDGWLQRFDTQLSTSTPGMAMFAAMQSVTSMDKVDLRSRPLANTLGASNDRDAIESWLHTLTLKSPNTREAYARDVHRLCLWASERGKVFSNLTVDDAVAHVQFLQNPPAHWVSELPHPKSSPHWRPMRGGLSPASVHRALGAIKSFFAFMVHSHYLVANPFAGISTPGRSKSMDTFRYFGDEHLVAIQKCLAGMAHTPFKTRLRALLMLLMSTGIRLSSTKATWADLVMVPNEDGFIRCLRVCEKGERERFIPIREELFSLLLEHKADRERLAAVGVVAALDAGVDAPLIGTLSKPIAGQHRDDASLSASGVHRVLKEFFAQTAAFATSSHVQEHLLKASAHWGRHTFAHGALKASDNDLAVVQALLGHASISTTGLYVKAAIGSRAQTIQRMALASL